MRRSGTSVGYVWCLVVTAEMPMPDYVEARRRIWRMKWHHHLYATPATLSLSPRTAYAVGVAVRWWLYRRGQWHIRSLRTIVPTVMSAAMSDYDAARGRRAR
jgi:hypothetical protein